MIFEGVQLSEKVHTLFIGINCLPEMPVYSVAFYKP